MSSFSASGQHQQKMSQYFSATWSTREPKFCARRPNLKTAQDVFRTSIPRPNFGSVDPDKGVKRYTALSKCNSWCIVCDHASVAENPMVQEYLINWQPPSDRDTTTDTKYKIPGIEQNTSKYRIRGIIPVRI